MLFDQWNDYEFLECRSHTNFTLLSAINILHCPCTLSLFVTLHLHSLNLVIYTLLFCTTSQTCFGSYRAIIMEINKREHMYTFKITLDSIKYMCLCIKTHSSSALWTRRWWHPCKNRYWGRNLGSLPPTGNEGSEQGMAPFLITKTKEVSNRTISREGYADSLLGKRRHFGALHA